MYSLVPPHRFATVEPGLYRGAYPTLPNFRHLESLNLKTIISLIPETPTDDLHQFCIGKDIRNFVVNCDLFKDHEPQLLPNEVNDVLGVLLDTANYPIYIHCPDGKQTTGLIIMALRCIMMWEESSIQHEYELFSKLPVMGGELTFLREYKGDFLTKPPDASRLPPWLWGIRIAQGSINLATEQSVLSPQGATRSTSPLSNSNNGAADAGSAHYDDLFSKVYGAGVGGGDCSSPLEEGSRPIYVCAVDETGHGAPYGCDPNGIVGNDRELWEFAFGPLSSDGATHHQPPRSATTTNNPSSTSSTTTSLPSGLNYSHHGVVFNAPIDVGAYRQFRHPTLPKFHLTTPAIRELPVAGKSTGSNPSLAGMDSPNHPSKPKTTSPSSQQPPHTANHVTPSNKAPRPFGVPVAAGVAGGGGKVGGGGGGLPSPTTSSPGSAASPLIGDGVLLSSGQQFIDPSSAVTIIRRSGAAPSEPPALAALRALLAPTPGGKPTAASNAALQHLHHPSPSKNVSVGRGGGGGGSLLSHIPPLLLSHPGKGARGKPTAHNALLCLLTTDEQRCRQLFQQSRDATNRRQLELLADWLAAEVKRPTAASNNNGGQMVSSTSIAFSLPPPMGVSTPVDRLVGGGEEDGGGVLGMSTMVEEYSTTSLASGAGMMLSQPTISNEMLSTSTLKPPPLPLSTNIARSAGSCTLKEYLLALAAAPTSSTTTAAKMKNINTTTSSGSRNVASGEGAMPSSSQGGGASGQGGGGAADYTLKGNTIASYSGVRGADALSANCGCPSSSSTYHPSTTDTNNSGDDHGGGCCDHLSLPLHSMGVSADLPLFAPSTRIGLMYPPSTSSRAAPADSIEISDVQNSSSYGDTTNTGVYHLLRAGGDIIASKSVSPLLPPKDHHNETAEHVDQMVRVNSSSSFIEDDPIIPSQKQPQREGGDDDSSWFPNPSNVLSAYSKTIPMLHVGHCHHNMTLRPKCTPLITSMDREGLGACGGGAVGMLSTEMTCSVHKDTPCFLSVDCTRSNICGAMGSRMEEHMPMLSLGGGCAHLRHTISLSSLASGGGGGGGVNSGVSVGGLGAGGRVGLIEATSGGGIDRSKVDASSTPTAVSSSTPSSITSSKLLLTPVNGGVGSGGAAAGGGVGAMSGLSPSSVSSKTSQGATSSASSTSSRANELYSRKLLRRRRSF